MEILSEQTPLLTSPTALTNKRYNKKKIFAVASLICFFCLCCWWWLLPWLVQGILNSAVVEIHSATISNISATGFLLQANMSFSDYRLYDWTDLETIETTLTLLTQGQVVGYVLFPRLMLKHYSYFSAPVLISNETQASRMVAEMLTEKWIKLQLAGPLTLELGWCRFDLSLEKDLPLLAMNGLTQTRLNGFDITGESQDSLFISANASTYNPSDLQLQLDCLSVHLALSSSSNAYRFARTTAYNVTLKPGDNEMELLGVIEGYRNPEQREELESLFSAFVSGHDSIVWLTGTDMQRCKTPDWLNNGIDKWSVSVVMPGVKDPTAMVESISQTTLDFSFATPEMAYTPGVEGGMTARLNPPLQFNFQVLSLSINQANLNFTIPFAHLSIPKAIPTRSDYVKGPRDMHFSFKGGELVVYQPGEFEQLMVKMLGKARKVISLIGVCVVEVKCALGILRLFDVPLSRDIEVKGMPGGMDILKPQFLSFNVTRGSITKGIMLIGKVSINTTDIDVALDLLPGVRTLVEFDGVVVGEVSMIPFRIPLPSSSDDDDDDDDDKSTNITALEATGALGPSWLTTNRPGVNESIAKLLSDYLSRRIIPLRIFGDASFPSTPVKSLLPALEQLSSTLYLPALDSLVVEDAVCHFVFSTLSLTLRNPLDTPIHLMGMTAIAYRNNVTVGRVNASDYNLTIPTRQVVSTKRLKFKLEQGGSELLKEAMGGRLNVSVLTTVRISIDAFLLSNVSWLEEDMSVRVTWF